MNLLVRSSLLFFTTSFCHLNAAEIRIAVDGSYAPFAETNKNGELFGFDIDITNALCNAMKKKCRIVPQTWDGMIPGLQAGKFDAVISSMSITHERLKVVDFSNRYYSNSLSFVGAKQSSLSTEKTALSGKNIGAYRSTVSSQYLEDNYTGIVNIKLYDTQELAYLDLKSHRIDFLLSDKFPAFNWLNSSAGQAFEFKGQDIDINDQIAIAFKKGSALAPPFNQAIQAILDDGTYQTINKKYFPFSIY